VRDGCHGPGKVKPLPRVRDLACLDVMGRGKGKGYAFLSSILDRGQHPEIEGFPGLAVGSPCEADPHPLVQVHARPRRMQVRKAEAGEVTHDDHHPSRPGVPRMSLILAPYEARVHAGRAPLLVRPTCPPWRVNCSPGACGTAGVVGSCASPRARSSRTDASALGCSISRHRIRRPDVSLHTSAGSPRWWSTQGYAGAKQWRAARRGLLSLFRLVWCIHSIFFNSVPGELVKP